MTAAERESQITRAFARISWELQDERFWAGEVDWPAPEREQPVPTARPNLGAVDSPTGAGASRGKVFAPADDPLLRVPGPVWARALTGIAVPSSGATINCPFPDHDDRTPSCRIHAEAGWGTWYCHGCHRGGDVYAFAQHLWGVPRARGEDFKELKREVARALLGEGVAA